MQRTEVSRPMPRSSDNSDCNLAADEIDDDFIERLFASPPPRLDQLFDDPAVRARVGQLISLAMSRSARLRRPRSSR